MTFQKYQEERGASEQEEMRFTKSNGLPWREVLGIKFKKLIFKQIRKNFISPKEMRKHYCK